MKTHRRSSLVLSTLVLGTVTSGTALAAPPGLVVQRSIAGVELDGRPREAVVAAWGAPDKVSATPLNCGIVYDRMIWSARRLEAGLMDSSRAEARCRSAGPTTALVALSTRSRRHRTREGLGVGSTERALRSVLRGARCAGYRGRRSCRVGSPIARHTTFDLRAGRVWRVTIAQL